MYFYIVNNKNLKNNWLKHDHAPSKSALYFDFPTEYIIYHNITLEKSSFCAHV